MTAPLYHYTESGLDNVWLASGFEFVEGSGGRRQVVINDIDGLHNGIGKMLTGSKKDLTGKEIRFLRTQMLMSQGALAKLLEVSEQAIHRWEKGKTGQVPKPAETLIRLLYRESIKQVGGPQTLKAMLMTFAELENAIDGKKLTARKTDNKPWQLSAAN